MKNKLLLKSTLCMVLHMAVFYPCHAQSILKEGETAYVRVKQYSPPVWRADCTRSVWRNWLYRKAIKYGAGGCCDYRKVNRQRSGFRVW